MISIDEAQQLMERLVFLREKSKVSPDADTYNAYTEHENSCIEKFKYLITMHTDRYKNFTNYDDLNQEGYEALLKAMNSYDPTRGNFFWWGHKYIETRICRQANNHSTIRYPMKFAKKNPPHKENSLPLLVEERPNSECFLETEELKQCVNHAVNTLSKKDADLIKMVFGIGSKQPMSINKICKKMKISRPMCLTTIGNALAALKENIKV